MNLENGSFMVCDRHPSQFFTAFCPACLAERLSSVCAAERSFKVSVGISREEGEAPPLAHADERTQDVKVRRTLSSLFRLDDEDKLEVYGERDSGRVVAPVVQLDCSDVGFVKTDQENGTAKVGEDCIGTGSQVSEITETGVDGASPGTKALSSCSMTVENTCADTCIERNAYLRGDEYLKRRGGTYWLGSLISRKVMKWMTWSSFRKNDDFGHEEVHNADNVEKFSEAKVKVRHSCDWSLFNNPKLSWEDPRHSWDGPVVGRSFMCSCSCLDEMEETSTRIPSETNVQKSSVSQGSERDFQEEGMFGDLKPPFMPHESSKNKIGNARTRGMHMPLESMVSKTLKDQFHEESHRDNAAPRATRKIFQKWSKVWNWSINSPFRDFSMKREQVLNRSLSESWRECHQVRVMESAESDAGSNFSGNGFGSSRTSTPFNRSKHFGNTGSQSAQVNWSRSRQGYTFVRSRSVHYSSPGNLENGLLRFYLTPLRSSRRNLHRGRTKTPRSLTRDSNYSSMAMWVALLEGVLLLSVVKDLCLGFSSINHSYSELERQNF